MLAGDVSHAGLRACANGKAREYGEAAARGRPGRLGPADRPAAARSREAKTIGTAYGIRHAARCIPGKGCRTATVHAHGSNRSHAIRFTSKCSASRLAETSSDPPRIHKKADGPNRESVGLGRRPALRSVRPARQRMSARWRSDQNRWRMPTVMPVRLRAPLLSSAMPAPPFTRVWSTAKYASVRLDSA